MASPQSPVMVQYGAHKARECRCPLSALEPQRPARPFGRSQEEKTDVRLRGMLSRTDRTGVVCRLASSRSPQGAATKGRGGYATPLDVDECSRAMPRAQ